MNLEFLKRLIRLVEESDIDSLEVERLTTRIRIRKSPEGGAPIAQVPGPAAVPPPPAPAAPAPGALEAAAASAPSPADGLFDVTSPMVGTFYRAASPESPPFVAVGDRVEPGQTLCILEAMKLMNELQSEVGGTIAGIAVENGEPVEFGQVLFRIDPD